MKEIFSSFSNVKKTYVRLLELETNDVKDLEFLDENGEWVLLASNSLP
jgi:hypothetical protein